MKVTDWKANREGEHHMKHEYDWSKLDEGWSYHEAPKPQLCDGLAAFALVELEGLTGRPVGPATQSALDQLAKCRITKPSAQQYDWSRLEGSGWVHGDGLAYITNYQYRYWYNNHVDEQLETQDRFSIGHAQAAQQEAESLVQKCRVDWRDEVLEACKDIDGLAEPYLMHGRELRLRANGAPGLFAVAFLEDRTYSLVDGVQTLEWVLKLSIVIERLKKRGWREA